MKTKKPVKVNYKYQENPQQLGLALEFLATDFRERIKEIKRQVKKK